MDVFCLRKIPDAGRIVTIQQNRDVIRQNRKGRMAAWTIAKPKTPAVSETGSATGNGSSVRNPHASGDRDSPDSARPVQTRCRRTSFRNAAKPDVRRKGKPVLVSGAVDPGGRKIVIGRVRILPAIQLTRFRNLPAGAVQFRKKKGGKNGNDFNHNKKLDQTNFSRKFFFSAAHDFPLSSSWLPDQFHGKLNMTDTGIALQQFHHSFHGFFRALPERETELQRFLPGIFEPKA